MKHDSLIAVVMAFANDLRFKQLFLLVTGLFLLDLFIPDMIPMIDEIILGLLAILLANLKKEKRGMEEGDVIEGEVVQEDEDRD